MKLMSTLSETTQSDGVGVAIGSETHTPVCCMHPW